MNDDTYEKARDPLKRYIARCPVCGSDAGLWTRKLGNVMCSNNQPIGPQEDDGYCGGPPGNFYKARKADAIAYWNAYATALVAMREEKSK
ncbi:MAG: hypothetical protein JSR83_01860 [Proteobacteria bacterium]|nr:hypothetical protein [Pseudomonadota bacterium]